MSTNPNNTIGTNAAYDGRTSVNAFNDIMGLVSRGVLSGWACVPNSGMTVSLGGTNGVRDIAIAEDNDGNRTSINNIAGLPVDVTMAAAPASNSRIDLIVAYVDNPPTGVSTTADNPAACGLITVEGTPAATPTAPSDGDIRTAITADGASGTTAYYTVLASVTIPTGTTDITSDMIEGNAASLAQDNVVKSNNIDFNTYKGEQFILRHTGGASFTLPAGYSRYRVQGSISYGSSAINSAMGLITSNFTGWSWARRIIEKSNGSGGHEVVGEQFEYNTGRVLTFGSDDALNTSSGIVVIDATITRVGSNIYSLVIFHHGGAECSGLGTGELHLSDSAGAIPLQFISTASPRTFYDADILVTGAI